MRRFRMVMVVAAGLSVASTARAASEAQIVAGFGHLPLSFEANTGQTDDRVSFISRGQGYTLYLTPTEAVLALHKGEGRPSPTGPRRDQSAPPAEVVRMTLLGGNPQAPALAMEPLPGTVNYFIGNDPTRWRHTIPLYARAGFGRVYRGVDLTYYGTQGQLEYDFTLAPGTDPRVITLAFDGVRQTRIDPGGELVLRTAGGEVRFHAPRSYQPHDGQPQDVPSRYVITGKNRVGFLVADYDRYRPLVIDPVLVYSTYLGGDSGYYGDYGNGITVDAAGNAYVIGGTESPNFPTTNAFQSVNGDGGTSITAFVTKLGPGGSNLIYSTYLGGSYRDCGNGIAVDAAGNAYVSGWTLSTNFPTRNAFQPALGGTTNAFVAKLGPGGSNLIYSTFLGGNGGYLNDWANAIAIDAAGNAYVTGSTTSTNFPTRNAFQTTLGCPAGNAFVTKFGGPGGSNLIYSTFLGGNGSRGGTVGDNGNGIAVDAAGNAYVTGFTSSTNFPTQNAFQAAIGGTTNAFVTKLGPDGSNLIYSTFLGGNGNRGDYGYAIAVDFAGDAYVTGLAGSTNFPTRNAFQKTLGGEANAFVTELGSSGTNLVYSTYLGGNSIDLGYALAMDAAGNAYVTGTTKSGNFPTTNAFQSTLASSWGNAFVTKIGGLGSVLRMVAIASETNDVRLTWTTAGGESYALQTNTPPANGNYSTNFADFTPAMTAPGRGVSTTNYVDTGAVTNFTSRYYRVRLVP